MSLILCVLCTFSAAISPSIPPKKGPVSPPLYVERDFSSLLGSLEGISDPLLKLHFQLYGGYVKSANEISQSLKELSSQGKDLSLAYGALKRRLNWEYDGMVLHELYFENLGGEKKLPIASALYKEIVDGWGSVDRWKQEFKSTGMMRGIGWVILCRDPKTKKLVNVWIEEHDSGHLAGAIPLIVMDVWEHAYLTQFGLSRSDYIDAFLNNLNWEIAVKRHLL